MDKATIGTILRDRIKEMGFTQEEFADKAGIGLSSLKKYMNGTTAYNYELMEIFTKELDCSYDYLLGLSKSTKREFHEINEQLRLSDEAIEKLVTYAKGYDKDINSKRYIRTLDVLIKTSGLMRSLTEYMIQSRYIDKICQLIKKNVASCLSQNKSVNMFIDSDDCMINTDTVLLIDVVSKLKDAKNVVGAEFVNEMKSLAPYSELEHLLDISLEEKSAQ